MYTNYSNVICLSKCNFGISYFLRRLHGHIVTGDTAAVRHSEINLKLKDVDLRNSDGTDVRSEEAINLDDTATGAGYGISSEDELGKNKRVVV